MAVPVISPAMKKIFGTRNERMVKRYLRVVDDVSAREDDARRLTDADLRAKTQEYRDRIAGGEDARAMQPEIFAVAREAMDRSVGIRNVFNPAKSFDPSQLPDAARRAYDETKAKMDAAEAMDPDGALAGCDRKVEPWEYIDIPNEVYDAVRELHPMSKPPFRARPFDVQIVGGIVLSEGAIAEMKTGEGKTIVAPLASYLAALEDKQVHVVTVNDYLVQRDRDWVFPFYRAVGLTVGAIHPMHMQPLPEKQKAYDCDVVYGTTSEFGFDYLRDNMKLSAQEQVQKRRHFAIVDEVDSVLIDEARTPLIISGPAHQSSPRYDLADELARHLVERQKEWNQADQRVQSCLVDISGLEGDIRNAREKDKVPALQEKLEAAKKRLPELEAARDAHTQFYEVELDKKKANLTHEGIEEAQRKAGLGSFYHGDNIDLPHLLEQSIRGHTVYQRDRDYVVAPGDDGQMSVVIVDQNTGRKMVGRQWSDGLHQAVEAKEGVPIKQETQTMATITIQNFFKLYKRLAGMTGTADTEATEFYEIYGLDVVVIPTNVPVVRHDYEDVVFLSEKDKWDAIVEEIKRFHDMGRPILVGTTSVENSEHLSQMLTKRHGVKHEVLNAKQHEREADIITGAGELGAVMIATNMAGRGTDIVLRQFTREALIDHWKRRGIAPRSVDASMDDDAIVAAVYRNMAPKELDVRPNEVEGMDDAQVRRALLERWAVELAMVSEGKAGTMSDEALMAALDKTGASLRHRLRMFRNIEDLGGLHVIGTERHESRRVDNQLRGRSGRQGDNGSSRFFLSLEDDLMKMFAGKTTLSVLSKLGMKEGDAIEHPMLTRSVGRAQRKVEERNFLIRKNILEYDEVMDHQRKEFYGLRQHVLEGMGVKDTIFDNIEEAVNDAVYRYLDKAYTANCIAEWTRENLGVSIDPERIRRKDREDLGRLLRIDAIEEAGNSIDLVLGEYMPSEMEPADWDYQSTVDWANATFHADLKLSEIRDLHRPKIRALLESAATAWIEKADLDPLDPYLIDHHGERELAKWAANKFGGDPDHERFLDLEEAEGAVDVIMEQARKAYREREMIYPIDFAMDMTTANMQQNPQQALQQFCGWARARYELEWTPNALPSTNPQELRKILVEEAAKWDEARIRERAERAAATTNSVDELDTWLREHVNAGLREEEKERAKDDPTTIAAEKIAEALRVEQTHFERWILLQILDQAWKDHLYAVDQLRESIGLRSFSQRDPRIEFKREGARLFEEMHQSVRDKVTDLVFKARLQPQVARRPQAPPDADGGQGAAPEPEAARRPAPAQPAVAAAAAAVGSAQQRADIEAASRAGAGGEERPRPKRKPARAAVTVGRNEPCPCGSGKKYKQCHGKRG